MTLSDLSESLLPCVIDAGREIMTVYKAGPEARIKDDDSPVTVADERAEKVILEAMTRLAPDITVIAEESVAADGIPRDVTSSFFLVDPLDGTKEFIRKGRDFTVNIGLVRGLEPVMGIVYAPADGRLFVGCKDEGAWHAIVDGSDGTISQRTALRTRSIDITRPRIVASKSHRTPETDAWLAHYPDADLVSCGSSLKFCLVACGEADIYPRLGPTMEWDTAAGDAVLRAAGGQVVDQHGELFTYGKAEHRNGWFLAWGDRDFQPVALAKAIA